jgi:lipid A ethanolaminephosphotransferase
MRAKLACRQASRSPFLFAIVVSLALVTFYNWRFWSETIQAVHPASIEDVSFLLSIFVMLILAHSAILLLMPNLQSLRIVAAIVLLLAAATAFFIDSYNVVIDKDMIRNLFETDSREVGAFVVPRLGVYLLLLGVVPAIIAFRTKLVSPSVRWRLTQRLGFFTMALGVSATLLFCFFPHYTSFFSEHKTRSLLNPAQPIIGLAGYVRSELASGSGPFVDDVKSHGQSVKDAVTDKPLLLFLVIGETARARNFQLGGYSRSTNPELSKIPNLYFQSLLSCGTSTAVSVPCIFSPQSHERLDVSEARRRSNLLDALQSAGVDVEWRENNSSSKGVAARVPSRNYLRKPRTVGCAEQGCYDEDMNSGLPERLEQLKKTSIIVFHQMGSHGPAYWQRYPSDFERFTPACKTSELWRCSAQALVNAYDNTILYTDHVLATQIRLLESVSAFSDSLLIYVSDHGESLGEGGLYLHGAPYALAPEDQVKVPLIIWMTDGYRRRVAIDSACVQAELQSFLTHDNIYHTVLGALGVRNAHYDQDLDLLGVCWGVGSTQTVTSTNPAIQSAKPRNQ